MKTVLIDNSLCTLAIKDDAEASDIDRYIQALIWAGVRYIEIDFRALMKLRYLPAGAGYIFRPIDPMFMKLADVFDFDYISLSAYEIMKYRDIGGRVMLSLPLPPNYMERSPREIIQCAERVIGGQVTSLRIRGDFPLMTERDAAGYMDFLKKSAFIPVDICPTSGGKTALNTAMSFMSRNTDSLTVTMGSSDKYCSLEELMMTLLVMRGGIPEGLSMDGLCKAAAMHTAVFRDSIENRVGKLVELFQDLGSVLNVDTGEYAAANALPKGERRFAKTFSDIVKGIHGNLEAPKDDSPLREAAQNASAKLFNSVGGENRRFAPPFLN